MKRYRKRENSTDDGDQTDDGSNNDDPDEMMMI